MRPTTSLTSGTLVHFMASTSHSSFLPTPANSASRPVSTNAESGPDESMKFEQRQAALAHDVEQLLDRSAGQGEGDRLGRRRELLVLGLGEEPGVAADQPLLAHVEGELRELALVLPLHRP